MRVLSLAAHQLLMRIEVEHLSHGGAENGRLPVTYLQFEEWAVRRHSVAGAIRELVALGIIEITQHGYTGAGDVRAPNLYRLTCVQAWDANDTGTHEYLKIRSVEQAKGLARAARERADPRNVERGKKNFAAPQNVPMPPHEMRGATAIYQPPKRGVHVHPPKRGALSISREGRLPYPHDSPPRTNGRPSFGPFLFDADDARPRTNGGHQSVSPPALPHITRKTANKMSGIAIHEYALQITESTVTKRATPMCFCLFPPRSSIRVPQRRRGRELQKLICRPQLVVAQARQVVGRALQFVALSGRP
jgi:hypothetical protein